MPAITNRRKFLGYAGSTALTLLMGQRALAAPQYSEFAFIEAEGFDDLGGWELDQQSMDQMGSPYLLAHGLGIPVKDATTTLNLPSAGTYRVWVRTKDWVAPWKAPGAPGKFQLLINDKPIKETFGTKGDQWHWHDGGTVKLDKKNKLSLHDLTGFEGRCEAILFCKDPNFVPSNNLEKLTRFRRKLLGLPDKPSKAGHFDLTVVGGGLAGTCAAISAARNGLKVALVQDRPVLGGNASEEVRVWPEGHTNKAPYPHVGDIVNEILTDKPKRGNMNGMPAEYFDDQKKLSVVEREPNITLFINNRAIQTSGTPDSITGVTIQDTITAEQKYITSDFFADCTGDAVIGHLAKADYEYEVKQLMGSTNLFSLLDASNEEQVLKCECKDKAALAAQYKEGKHEQPFPRCPWALDLSNKPFPGRDHPKLSGFSRKWYWESGFDKDQVNDIELIRDHNFRAIFGAWDAIKNVDKKFPNHRLGWVAFIAGKRESRRLLGDVILDGKDFMDMKEYNDGCFPCSWHIDLHFPQKKFQKGFEGNEFISDYTRGKDYKYSGTYWAPYRCLYSRNIKNLFMAGRDISVTKSGLGPVRVMKTCGMMGEIVGKAAALCVQNKTTPRGIYQKYLPQLKVLMQQPGTKSA
ncbi:FAD-dependent oxidoreductase [Rubritalea tangerina]|uniref:FAD-dependent oxidoreductase n=1 Tax=Rubritalea tangerina TaxID=430798 RepID=A0ABW4ZEN2_9BACT